VRLAQLPEFILALEQAQFARWLRASFVSYPLISAVHILSIGALLTSVILMDLRLIGLFRSIPEQPLLRLLRRLALIAFGIAVLTGLTLFSVRAADYSASRLFLLKMVLIGLAALNFIVFSALDRIRGAGESHSILAYVSILVSIAVWLAILVAGRFLGFV
jgi:hypothetical protein